MNPQQLSEVRARVRAADRTTSDEVFESVIDELEDSLLSENTFSEEHFSVLNEVFQDDSLFSKPGAWRVAMSIYHDRDKLTDQQRADLLTAIVENYRQYWDEKLCLTTADLVARGYPIDAAMEALRLMGESDTKPCIAGVKVALNALACNLDPKDHRLTEIKRRYGAASDRAR